MGMPMIEKILARSAGRDRVRPGEIVVCEVDRVVMLDLSFTAATEPPPKRLANPSRVAVILDHGAPAPSVIDAAGHQKAREFVQRFGVGRFYDIGHHGICHQVILEEGLALPGQVLACSDSHTCASGAVNCAARGLGRIEVLQILCTGKTWYRVAPTVRYELVGRLAPGVYGKDVFLSIAGRHGDHVNQNVEFGGPGLPGLALDDRSTIATMCAEISAEFATFPADQVVLDYLRGRADEPFAPVDPDLDADYLDVRRVELGQIEPYVSRPDFVPHNTLPVGEVGDVPIHQAFVGSCANGKLQDLRIAAEILRGRRVHPGVRCIVTPASQRVYLEAVRRGYVETLVEAGAVVTNSTCGACFGYHMGVLGPGEVCVTSSTRNFKGRMGSPESRVYLASSATVAASAVEGRIADPRPYLAAEA
ncbi:MAG: 3-isopropylmalate dehydratase large subunit [Chloroflexi bacterium]|nr:3-isopropylmalate dehydratase large subunit [Chloroflexota bacterium]